MKGEIATAPRRLPSDFLLARRRERIADGFAEVVDRASYRDVHIADIVRAAGVGRKTLYDSFDSKEAVALYVLTGACPSLADRLDGGVESTGLSLLLVELAATHRAGATDRALFVIGVAAGVLSRVAAAVEPSTATEHDPLRCTLPPGRHGLPREFVVENQRTRLHEATATAIAQNGYAGTTISQIAKAAAVSRRTFYEHFEDKAAAAKALTEHACPSLSPEFVGAFGAVVVELVATGYTQGEVRARAAADDAAAALNSFSEAITMEVIADAA